MNTPIIAIIELDKLPWKAFAKCVTYISITKENLPLRTPTGETVPERKESGEVGKEKKKNQHNVTKANWVGMFLNWLN